MKDSDVIINNIQQILDLEQVLQEALEHNEIAGTHYATINMIIINKIKNLFDTILQSSRIQ